MMHINVTPPTIQRISEIADENEMSMEELDTFINCVTRSLTPVTKRIKVSEDGLNRYLTVQRRGIGILKTEFGSFWNYIFSIDDTWEDYMVLVKSEIDDQSLNPIFSDKENLIVRTDSGCATGQVFRDMTCDCLDQLYLAMKTIHEKNEGMIIHIPHQDGRGMGLPFKLGTLWLQDELGVDTVTSAALLAPNGVIDMRTYAGVIGILRFFDIPTSCKVNLATNNPHKEQVFAENEYELSNRIPIKIEPTEHTAHHLRAKQSHLGHMDLMDE